MHFGLMKGKHLSLGRLMTYVTFGLLTAYWLSPLIGEAREIPTSLVTVFQSLLTYEVFKKGRDIMEKRFVQTDDTSEK